MPGRLRFILSWDAGVLVAMVLLFGLRNTPPDMLTRIAAGQDAGKWAVLFLTLIAAGANLVAIAGEVPLIRHAAEFEKILRISLIIATIVLSWTFIHTIFALHYAHDYYSSGGSRAAKTTNKGLAFPGPTAPTYMDFAYFSFTIGMTFQVSDVEISSRRIRHQVLVHSLLAFALNTFVVALAINVIAGLKG